MSAEGNAAVATKTESSPASVFIKDFDVVLEQATELRGVLYGLQSKLSGPSPTADGPTPTDISESFWVRINDTKTDVAATLEGCLIIARKLRSDFSI